jgi:hypothetical protein
MKHFILTIILIATLQVCNAQSQAPYRPMHLDVGTTWYMLGTGNCPSGAYTCTRLTSLKDTFINGLTYYKLKAETGYKLCGPQVTGTYYFRNDTLNKKVYIFTQTSSPDNLVYNFDLQIGDTLEKNYYFVIDSIYTVTLSVGPTTRYRAHALINGTTFKEYLTEGFGGDQGYLFYSYGPTLSVQYFVSAGIFDSNKTLLYGTGSCIPDTFVPTPISVENFKISDLFTISPNPVFENFTIKNLTGKELSAITIVDVFGKVVLKQNSISQNLIIDCSTWTKGIYFVQINQGNEQAVYKLLKE